MSRATRRGALAPRSPFPTSRSPPSPPPLALEPNDLDELRQRFELIADELRQRADALSHALDLVEGELERERNKSKAVLNRLGKLEKAMSDLDFHAAWLEQFVSDAGLMN